MKTRGTKERLFATTLLAGMAAILGATPATAQDAPPPAAADEVEDEEEAAIVVTGSRIRRSEYSSSQPIQVIDAAAARSFGAVDTAGLLQDSIAAGGPQVDSSFASASAGNGASNATERPPSGGPGSSSISLRGLDAERTLVLLNGRRLAPAGAGGAPTRPDVNLLPSSMVERVEILTGGASAIYGADAVAGVVNIITRQNFDGLELQAFRSQPEQGGGETSQINFIMGAQGDRGNVTFAAEFFERNRIAVRDRDYASCHRDIVELFSGSTLAVPGTSEGVFSFCRSDFPDNSVFTSDTSRLLFYQPGQLDPVNCPGPFCVVDWSRRVFGTLPGFTAGLNDNLWRFDRDPAFVANGGTFGEFNDNDDRLDADLFAPLRRFSFYSQGAFDLGVDLGGGSPEVYYEMFYGNRQTRSQATPEQALPIIPHEIPMLNVAGDEFLRDGVGNLLFFDNPLSPFAEEVEGIFTITNDFDQIRRTEVEQIRLAGGIRGETDNLGPINNFGYDFFATYDRTLGFLSQKILYEPNVFFGTTGIFLENGGVGAGDVTCGVGPWLGTGEPFTTLFDLVSPAVNANGLCTPIDWLNVSVLNEDRLATQAERDFVFADRTNRTVVEQSVFGAAFTGDLWEMPGGTAAFAFGLEHRIDSIVSINDVTVERGLQASETVQSEGNAGGETYQNDIYLEAEFPLMADRPLVEELTLNAAVRYTSEKSFGNASTYSLRGIWSPTDWLSFRATYATSFRAPNLREQFLALNASGTVGSSNDPCYVPSIAIDPGPVYNAANDPRTANLLAACVLSGADPTQLGINGFSLSVPTFTTGSATLDPETGESRSFGFVLTNQWTDLFDADLAVTYWETTVSDTVEELGATDVIFGCFFSAAAPFTDPLCSRISRSATGDPRNDILSGVETSFRNIGAIEVEGVDLNFRISKELGDFLWSFNSANSYLMSLARQTDAELPTTRTQFAGTQNNSRWENRNVLTVAWDDFSVGWRSSYIQGTVSARRATQRTQRFASITVCSYPVLGIFTPRVCREIDETNDYWKHDVNLNYNNDAWSFTVGVNNVTDEAPPLVSARYQERNNAVTGGNYDLYGRTVFANVRRSF